MLPYAFVPYNLPCPATPSTQLALLPPLLLTGRREACSSHCGCTCAVLLLHLRSVVAAAVLGTWNALLARQSLVTQRKLLVLGATSLECIVDVPQQALGPASLAAVGTHRALIAWVPFVNHFVALDVRCRTPPACSTTLFVTLPGGKSLSPLVNVHLDVPPQVQRRLPQVALASTPCPKIALGHVQNLQKVSPVGRDLFDLVNPLDRIFQQFLDLDDWTCLGVAGLLVFGASHAVINGGSKRQLQLRILLDVAISHRAPVLELLAREDEALLVGWDVLLVADLALDRVNCVRQLHLECDGLVVAGVDDGDFEHLLSVEGIDVRGARAEHVVPTSAWKGCRSRKINYS